MDMDMYFFKAGKRENPMLGKLDDDMDSYWASKDAAKKEEASEAPAEEEAAADDA